MTHRPVVAGVRLPAPPATALVGVRRAAAGQSVVDDG
jgi:xanthosine utilization system XapX-like protein